MSVLLSKSSNVKNSEKAYMITKLSHDLDVIINSVDYLKIKKDYSIYIEKVSKNQDFLSESTTLPCINYNCEFLSYLKIFYPTLKFFKLPAYDKKFNCVVCSMIKSGNLQRSQIQILNNNKIRLQN